jgi:hypothetical protein
MPLHLTHKELQLIWNVLSNVDDLLEKQAMKPEAAPPTDEKFQRLQKLVAANLRVKLNNKLRIH